CLRIALVLTLMASLGPHQRIPVGQHSTDEIFPLLSGQSGYPFAEGFQHCAHFDEAACSLLAFVGLGSR
ncbi:hypothetical protein, partial [Stenotrophomonas maltophilia]|uniref:hypothetical protein n=1 Tax=Stenotrophomonas maltophilia TaxID=40324 RepID=UPI001954542E